MATNSPLLLEIGQGLSIMIGLPTISSWKDSTRPQKAKSGTFGFNTQRNSLEYSDGKNWYTAPLEKA